MQQGMPCYMFGIRQDHRASGSRSAQAYLEHVRLGTLRESELMDVHMRAVGDKANLQTTSNMAFDSPSYSPWL